MLFPDKSKKKRPEPGNGNGRKDRKELQRSPVFYGEYLKQIREERGLTLENVAEISGIEPGVLRLLEEGESALLPEGKEADNLVRRYARYLGVDAENGD